MWDKLDNEELQILYGIQNDNLFITQLGNYINARRIKEIIQNEAAQQSMRASAFFNKGIFLASVPTEVLWMLVSIGVLTSISLIITFAIASIGISALLAWYAIETKTQSQLQKEEKLLVRKFCAEVRRSIITVLHNRKVREVDHEITKVLHANNPRHHNFGTYSHIQKVLLLGSLYQGKPADNLPLVFWQDPTTTVEKHDKRSYLFTGALISTLLGTLFWGSSQIFLAVGATAVAAAMTSPIGVVVAVTVAALLTGYLCYQRYRYDKHIENIEKKTGVLEQRNAELYKEYSENCALLKEYRSEKVEQKQKLQEATFKFLTDPKADTTKSAPDISVLAPTVNDTLASPLYSAPFLNS